MVQVMAGMLTGAKPLSEAEITALVPNQHIAWTGIFAKMDGEFNRAEWEIDLEPDGTATRVIQRFRYLPQTTAARHMVAALGDANGIAQCVAVNLGQLKQKVETSRLQFP